jgi:outer membrane biogenesis lipoprotein LolB
MVVRLRRVVVAGLAMLLLGACSSGGSVDWENYSPDVRTRIDDAAASGDCAALQAEFDNADANDSAQRNRTGDGNADLMGYIDAKLSEAGCYA